ncbi:MAG: hypothetical protein AABY43_01720 [Candidatus Omnitrophota bacterium]
MAIRYCKIPACRQAGKNQNLTPCFPVKAFYPNKFALLSNLSARNRYREVVS